MPKADGSIIIDTKINTDGFSKGASDLKSQFGGLGSSLKKLGGLVAAAFSVKVIADFAKEAINLGSDLQEVQNVVNVTFTTMSKQVDNFAQAAQKTAGLSETMAKKYMGTFGAMSKSFGFTEKQAYAMSASLTQLTGDVASFYNLSQDEAYTKLKSVFTGETESLKDLGVVMTQTALDDFAMRQGIGKTTAQMSEQEKVALRYQFVLEQLNGASGDFVRTADGWANQTKVLSLQFEQLKATLGQGFINVLTPVIRVINELLSKLQTFAVAFKKITEALFGNASDGSGGVAGAFNTATDSAENLGESVTAAGKAAKKSLAGFDELTLLADRSSGSGGSSSGSTSTGLGDFNIDFSTDNLTGTASTVIGNIQPIVDKIKELVAPLKEIDTTDAKNALSKLGDAFSKLGSKIGKSLEWVWFNILVPLGEWVIQEAAPALIELLAAAFEVLADVLDFLAPVLEAVWDILEPILSLIGDIVIFLLDAITLILNFFSGSLEQVPEQAYVLSEAEQALAESTREAAEAFREQNEEVAKTTAAVNAEAQQISSLVGELDRLVDENGRVDDANKARAETILTQLNEKLGTEYKLTGNLIKNYQDLRLEINKLIKSKQAKLLLDARESQYAAAMEAKTDAWQTAQTSEKAFEAQKELVQQKYDELKAVYEKEFAELSAMYGEEYGWNDDQWNRFWHDSRIRGEAELLVELKSVYEQDLANYQSYVNTIGEYELAFALMTEENYGAAVNVLTGATVAFVEAGETQEDVFQKQLTVLAAAVDETGLKAQEIKKAFDSGTADFGEDMVKDAQQAHIDAISAFLNMYAEANGIGNEFVGGFQDAMNGIDELSAEHYEIIVNAFESIGLDADEIFSGIGVSFDTEMDAMPDAASLAASEIKSSFEAAATSLKGTFYALGGVIGAALSSAGKGSFGTFGTAGANLNTYSLRPNVPFLAKGAVIPPNAPFMAVLGDQRRGTNVEAPLSTIREAVAGVMSAQTSAILAGFEALLEENRQLRAAVEGIEVGDTVIGEAAGRYNHKMAIRNGG